MRALDYLAVGIVLAFVAGFMPTLVGAAALRAYSEDLFKNASQKGLFRAGVGALLGVALPAAVLYGVGFLAALLLR